MFHFPALPPHRLYIHRRVTRHHSCRVSPFGHPRIQARLTAPRGLSQPPTSFIGFRCQGIHHAPLNTYNTKTKSVKNKLHQTEPQKLCLIRCSQPLSTNQTPHPTTKMERQHTHPTRGRQTGLLPPDPTVCPRTKSPWPTSPERPTGRWKKPAAVKKHSAPPTTPYGRRQTGPSHRTPRCCGGGGKRCSLERR